MELSPMWCDPVNILVSDSLRGLFVLGLLTIPLGWLLALVSLVRPLAHGFVGLSHVCRAVEIALGTFFAMIVAAFLLVEPQFGLAPGPLAATPALFLSGVLAWTVVARQCRPEEPIPSLLA